MAEVFKGQDLGERVGHAGALRQIEGPSGSGLRNFLCRLDTFWENGNSVWRKMASDKRQKAFERRQSAGRHDIGLKWHQLFGAGSMDLDIEAHVTCRLAQKGGLALVGLDQMKASRSVTGKDGKNNARKSAPTAKVDPNTGGFDLEV